MAEVLGVNQTRYDAGTSNNNWIDQGLIKSGLKIWSDSYEAAALPANDTIVVAELPDGAIVHLIQVSHDALGAATIDVGDTTDVDRYIDGYSVAAAGSTLSILPNGSQYVIGTNSGDGRIQITVLGAAVTGTIKTVVYYTN